VDMCTVNRVLVTGETLWTCRALALTILRRLVARYGEDITVAHSGNPGVPTSFGIGCRQLGIKAEMPPLDWHRGVDSLARNERLISTGADLCVVVHRSLATCESTKDCARRAIAAGIPTYLIETDRAYPIPLQAGDWRLA
jgi:hypothetical protein